MWEYEFETIRADQYGGEGLVNYRLETRGHRELILRRAAEGWRFVAAIPAAQQKRNSNTFLQELDLVFERETPDH